MLTLWSTPDTAGRYRSIARVPPMLITSTLSRSQADAVFLEHLAASPRIILPLFRAYHMTTMHPQYSPRYWQALDMHLNEVNHEDITMDSSVAGDASQFYHVRLLDSLGLVIPLLTPPRLTSSHRYTSLLNIALSLNCGTTEPRDTQAFLHIVFIYLAMLRSWCNIDPFYLMSLRLLYLLNLL